MDKEGFPFIELVFGYLFGLGQCLTYSPQSQHIHVNTCIAAIAYFGLSWFGVWCAIVMPDVFLNLCELLLMTQSAAEVKASKSFLFFCFN